MEEIKVKTTAEMEKEEARLLIGQGKDFKVTYTLLEKQKGIVGFFKKPVTKNVTEIFNIKEPTLGTLDRVSLVLIDDMPIDEAKFKGNEFETIANARKIVVANAKKLAKVIAIVAIGDKFNFSGNYEKEIKRVSELFYYAIKPSDLLKLATFITSTENLKDFINSIRLMSGARTTQPIVNRVE
ncbi:MAG: hypothetical protein LBS01_02330 [Prevotellaceae bacterium]|jgi:hypothetical protein|nr:hypothetical protein [Prevotellaceae bacterium]